MKRWFLWLWATWSPAWQLGWPSLWRDRWRWLARRWAFALAGFAAGLVGVGSWYFDALEMFWENEAQIRELHEKLELHSQAMQRRPDTVAAAALTALSGPPPVMAWWPAPGTQASVWPQLERLMVQHGLRLESLRPEPPRLSGLWPSQRVALRLQGRFEDWVSVWALLNARGPVWAIELLRIAPLEGGVAVEVVLRLSLSPVSSGLPKPDHVHLASELMPLTVRPALRSGLNPAVFVSMPSPGAIASEVEANPFKNGSLSGRGSPAGHAKGTMLGTPSASEPVSMISTDPALWPLDQVRLAGVWRQAQATEFILTAGPHWVPARLGQRIGPQGHVVQSIQADEVHLRAAQGPAWVIGLEKAKP